MKRKFRIAMTLLLCGMVALSAGGCTQGTVKSASVSAATVEKKSLDPQLTIEGVLVPTKTAVVSSRISGQIDSVAVATGNLVKAGQILVTLDKRAIAAQLNQAGAGLQTAQASQEMTKGQVELAKITLDAAQKNYERIKALNESGAASQSQMDDASDKLSTAKTQYNNATGPSRSQAAASVSTAGANVNNLQVQLDYTNLVSPVEGIVTVQNAVIGETVSPGTALVTVADISALKLKGMVSQDMLPVLKLGQTVKVTVGIYPEAPIEGTLTGIGPTSVGTGELFPIEITVPNTGKLMVGLTASASIETQGRTGIVIPDTAIVQESGKHFAYIIKDGVASKTEIIPGLSHNRETEVLKGLKEGDSIAVTGAGSLKDGMKVTVRK